MLTNRNQWNSLSLIKNEAGPKEFLMAYKITAPRPLGKGGFRTVFAGVRKQDGKPVAIKLIKRTKVDKWDTLNSHRIPLELKILSKVQEMPGVIRSLGFYKGTSSFLFVMERPTSQEP